MAIVKFLDAALTLLAGEIVLLSLGTRRPSPLLNWVYTLALTTRTRVRNLGHRLRVRALLREIHSTRKRP